ncbi:MAG: hypothetical protein SVY15_08970 [Halobacteriota archaeon]|nr:hypothetical protein [Halobacteriota archaeon]
MASRNWRFLLEVLVGGDEGKISNFINFASENFPIDAEVSGVSIEE